MTYLKNPPLSTHPMASHSMASHPMASHSMASHPVASHPVASHPVASNQFCWTGQLVDFVSGEKSPRQSILLKVACVHDGDDVLLASSAEATHLVRLGKSLQRMMTGYLSSSDWLRVLGKCKVDAHSGELIWKAQEIVKLSAAQVQSLELLAFKSQCLPESVGDKQIAASQPVRVLVCQHSSCRQRGSAAVSQVIDDALKASTGCSKVSVQAVGCLKNCKLGPNVRLLPKGKLQSQGLKTRYDNVTSAAAREIVDRLDMVLDAVTD